MAYAEKIYQSQVDLSKKPYENFPKYLELMGNLQQLGVRVEKQKINISKFELWLSEFSQIDEMYRDYGDVYIEKCLEHFLSYQLLSFKKDEIFIDVASSGSQYANELFYKNKVKNTYLLDLAYPKGINGTKIGANAGDTGLPDDFVDTLGLHCAFECFEGDADIKFIDEADRILKPNGRYVITPLYIDNDYYNCTSEKCNQSIIDFDTQALKVWRNDEYAVPFSRHYSPESFFERIYQKIPDGMSGAVIFYENLPELMKYFPGQRIYCYFLFYCKKNSIESI